MKILIIEDEAELAKDIAQFLSSEDYLCESATNFTSAIEIQWEKENATEYEAEFKLNNKSYSANFAADGTWKETEYKIKSTELPSDVKSTITKEYVGYTISKAEVVESPSGSFYEVRLTKEDLKVELVIDKSGKIIKKK